MGDAHVSIGQVKRDVSELVNRVAYGGERIVLTSRGKPKAVLVSLADYEQLGGDKSREREAAFELWLQRRDRLMSDILESRSGTPIDLDRFWEEARADLEDRHDFLLSD